MIAVGLGGGRNLSFFFTLLCLVLCVQCGHYLLSYKQLSAEFNLEVCIRRVHGAPCLPPPSACACAWRGAAARAHAHTRRTARIHMHTLARMFSRSCFHVSLFALLVLVHS